MQDFFRINIYGIKDKVNISLLQFKQFFMHITSETVCLNYIRRERRWEYFETEMDMGFPFLKKLITQPNFDKIEL